MLFVLVTLGEAEGWLITICGDVVVINDTGAVLPITTGNTPGYKTNRKSIKRDNLMEETFSK